MDEYLYCVTVWDTSHVIVRRAYFSCIEDAIKRCEIYPDLSELINGYSYDCSRNGKSIFYHYLNPKIHVLVETLFLAGITTTISGDMCGNDLVYVDLADEYQNILGKVVFPLGWIIAKRMAFDTYVQLGLEPNELVHDIEAPRVRLARRGGLVCEGEANVIVKALLDIIGANTCEE